MVKYLIKDYLKWIYYFSTIPRLLILQLVTLHDHDLRSGVLSTLNQFNYSTPVSMSVINLLQFMLRESCNSATDAILRLIGGTQEVMHTLQAANLTDLRVDRKSGCRSS